MPTAPNALSVVLLGYGLGGRVFHGPLVTAEPGLSLDAIVTRDEARADQARAAYPGVRVYSTPEEAWAGGHDLAVISTANVTHVPYAAEALAAGMHVVLDKPIAPTADAAQALASCRRMRKAGPSSWRARSVCKHVCRVASVGGPGGRCINSSA